MRSTLAVVGALALGGCLPAVAARHPGRARESVESLWDFAPRDASDGVVFHRPLTPARRASSDASASSAVRRGNRSRPLLRLHLVG